MRPVVHAIRAFAVAAVAIPSVLAGPAAGAPPATPVDEVVMYGVDADTNMLLRYEFETGESLTIGELRDPNGYLIDDVESLAYIPTGPHKGFYGVPTKGFAKDRLVKINPLDATSQAYAAGVGFEAIVGMIAVRETPGNNWIIYATHSPPLSCVRNLIRIDPATGVGTVIMAVPKKLDGLARGPDGTLFAVHDNELWTLDPDHPLGPATSIVGQCAYTKIEALEYAFGDHDPGIEVPGVPAEWTADGVLFGFSDNYDAFLIFNPDTGEASAYPCSIDTPDCEGIVFVTRRTDPYAPILINAYD